MSHQALARKYRPRRFAEVATQEHVSETLRRAVAGDRVGHAYLFCGPRGVGKTTLARVLAMALNCPERTEEGEPCGECESCRRIWGGHTALDVVEIDAASNRGVDDARDLRERAMYSPSEEGRHKVYIVDEAHMLTREAWNALLKILEEPPPRVIFVFATTDPQKIEQAAAPILSRCQRFDFKRIGVRDIVRRLGEVLEMEGVPAPDDALRILARKAEGGMRDGLSLLDQALALTGGELDPESVRRILGLVEEERYLALLDILADHRHGDVFGFVEELLDDGYDLVEFYHGLVTALRTLLRIALSGPEIGDLREELREAYAVRAARFHAGDLVRMLALASDLEADGKLRRSSQPRLLLEMLLLRLSYLDRTVDLEELIGALGGAPSGARGHPDPGGGAPGGRGAGATVVGSSRPASASPSRGSGPGASAPSAPAPPPSGAGGSTSPAPTPSFGPPGPDAPSPGDPSASSPGPADPVRDEVGPATPGAPAPEGGGVTLAEAWERVLREPKGLPAGATLVLRAGRIAQEPEGVVRLDLPPMPGLERVRSPAVVDRLRELLGAAWGRPADLRLVGEGEGPPPARITPEALKEQRLQELLSREPLLRQAVEELDLELLD